MSRDPILEEFYGRLASDPDYAYRNLGTGMSPLSDPTKVPYEIQARRGSQAREKTEHYDFKEGYDNWMHMKEAIKELTEWKERWGACKAALDKLSPDAPAEVRESALRDCREASREIDSRRTDIRSFEILLDLPPRRW